MNEEELSELRVKAKGLKQNKWNKNKIASSTKLIRNNKSDNWYLSKPIFTKSEEYAFIFNVKAGTSIMVYKKNGEIWNFFCEIPLGIN